MDRKLTALAVAGAFAAPSALAQSAVTISGTINITYDSVRAGGATGVGTAGASVNNNIKSHDRVRDGAGSNIRFFVGEDLGVGNQAFVQVESAVIGNADTRADMVGAAGGLTNIWGNRNTAIGLRSKSMGRFLIGVWDLHYDEMGGIDPMPSLAYASNSYLGMMQNMGAALSVSPGLGSRYSNVLRWDSPNWSGFSMTLGYARPTDPAPPNAAQAGAGVSNATIRDGKKNRAWHLAARYETGGFQVRYSYLNDKDANSVATLAFGGTAAANGVINGTLSAFAGSVHAGTSVWKITSNRLGARYRWANGFGVGLIWDNSKFSASHETVGTAAVASVALGGTSIKRTAWAFPLTYETGNHVFAGTYARARDWRGTLLGTSVGGWGYNTTTATFGAVGAVLTPGVATATHTLGGDTGARLWTLSYQYKLSQRTSVYASYVSIRNDPLVRYDFYSIGSGTAAGNFGADPRALATGVRHVF